MRTRRSVRTGARSAAQLALVACVLSGGSALAQTTPASKGEDETISGYRASAPLRLSLEGSVPPIAGQFPQCQTLGDDVGNSVGGIPVQHYREVRVAPRLVLSLFSQLGCPIDAGMGAALTYAAPVARSTWFVFGAGVYAAPARLPLAGGVANALRSSWVGTLSPVAPAAVRADVVWQTASGRPLSVGFESMGRGRQTITFAGGF